MRVLKNPGVRTITASAPSAAARLQAFTVMRTDSRPVPAISHFSRGYSSRAAAITASDSSSSSEAASPLLPRTTRPASGVVA